MYKDRWPYIISFVYEDFDLGDSFRKQNWLANNIGKNGVDWMITSPGLNKQDFHFIREEDAVLFSLKWS